MSAPASIAASGGTSDTNRTVVAGSALAAGEWDAERMIVAHERSSGLRAVIVIDSTALGPALGGIRLRRYPSQAAAIADCRRLARAMTLKNTLAETGYGGGKAVIAWSDEATSREEVMRAFGRLVKEELCGRYIPASDVGTGNEDLTLVGAEGVDVLGGDTDTSISTATGLHAALWATVRHTGLEDTRAPSASASKRRPVSVCVQGAGKVGARLARLLAADGARVCVSDIDPDRATRLARELGAEQIDPAEAIESDCDVLAPCAIGGVISSEIVPRLRCRVVAGAANNILADLGAAAALSAAGIAHVPDFLASAGGVIQVRAVRDGWSQERLQMRLRAIGDTVSDILAEAETSGRTPVEVGETLAARRLKEVHPHEKPPLISMQR